MCAYTCAGCANASHMRTLFVRCCTKNITEVLVCMCGYACSREFAYAQAWERLVINRILDATCLSRGIEKCVFADVCTCPCVYKMHVPHALQKFGMFQSYLCHVMHACIHVHMYMYIYIYINILAGIIVVHVTVCVPINIHTPAHCGTIFLSKWLGSLLSTGT